jgi:hypothetical protein
LPQRDAADVRVVRSVRDGEGGHLDSQAEVGGWPELHGPEPPRDTDRDGMPDHWETAHGLDPDNFAPNADSDGDHYTDLEEFLNRTDPQTPSTG